MRASRPGVIICICMDGESTHPISPAPDALLRCSKCGAKNRVARERMRQAPSCGRCHAALVAQAPVNISDADWQIEVDASPIPVLVDFWAPWCGPCRTMGPALEEIARENAGRLKVVKLNVDENPGSASRFEIQAIPTLLLFDRGRMVDGIRGALPKETLRARLRRHTG